MEEKIRNYVNSFGFNEIISNRLISMYIRQAEHIIDMNHKLSKLKNFQEFSLFNRTIKFDEFQYENEDELIEKSIKQVDKIISKIFCSNDI